MIWTICVNGLDWLYVTETGKMINFDMLQMIFDRWNAIYAVGSDRGKFVVYFFIAYFFVFCALYKYIKYRNRKIKQQYVLLDDEKASRSFNFSYFVLIYVLLFLIPYIFKSKTEHDAIYENTTLKSQSELSIAAWHYFNAKQHIYDYKTKPASEASLQNRTSENVFQNVVFLFLETTREDMMPFNRSSKFAKKSFGENAPNLTPFLESLLHSDNAVRVPNAKSTCSFTIKSLMSTLCGIYPIPVDFTHEIHYNAYAECLPQLLNRSGYNSIHVQISDDNFDHQKETIIQQGFQKRIGWYDLYDIYKEQHLKTPEAVNSFGGEDHYAIPIIKQFIKNSKNANKPYLISHLLNIMHHPYVTPKWFKKRKYLSNKLNNDYLNALRYSDLYFKDLMDEIDDENTLFVFLGDHGLATGENNLYGVGEMDVQEVFQVPLFFYSKNEQFKQKIAPMLRQNIKEMDIPFTNLDVLPTLLDLLQLKTHDFITNSILDPNFEGTSLMRPNICHNCREMTLHFSSPGFTSVIVRYQLFKLILMRNGNEYFVDFKTDPNESNRIYTNEIPLDDLYYSIIAKMRDFRDGELKRIKSKWNFTE
eukprot:NODE_693_length_4690_cov_0.933130.p1 type:complete len:589 gc:universal NODE_693_length_4690_cov_0.933130:1-1767(+)